MQPELAIALGDVLSAFTTGLTALGSFSAILAGLARWRVSETLLVASGLTGCVMLARSFVLSKPLLVGLEMYLNRDLNLDGVIGKPEPAPAVIPSTNWAEDAYANARQLWDYTHAQLRAADDDGRKLRTKPWSRRQQHGLTHDEWDQAVDVWVAGGLLDDRNARTLNTKSLKRGLDFIDRGMTTLNFIKTNGQSWMPR